MADHEHVVVFFDYESRTVTVPKKDFLNLVEERSVFCPCTATSTRRRCKKRIGDTPIRKLPDYEGCGLVVATQLLPSRQWVVFQYYCPSHWKRAPLEFLEAFDEPEQAWSPSIANVSITTAATKLLGPVQVSEVGRQPLAFKSTNSTVKASTSNDVKPLASITADSNPAQHVVPPKSIVKSEDIDASAQKPRASEPFTLLEAQFEAVLSALRAPPSSTFVSSKSLDLDDTSSLPLSGKTKKLSIFNDQDHQLKLEVSAKAPVKDEKSTIIPKDPKLPISTTDTKILPDISNHISSHATVTVNQVEIETAAPSSSIPSEATKAPPPVEPPTPTWEQTANNLKKELAEMRQTMERLELIIVQQALEIKNNARPDDSDSRDSADRSEKDTDTVREEKNSQEGDTPPEDAAATAPAETENEKTGLISEPADVRARPSMSMSRGLQTEPSSSSSSSSQTRDSGFWKSLDFVLCGCNFGRRYEEI